MPNDKKDMGAQQPFYDITLAAVTSIKTVTALRRQLPLSVETLKKLLDKAKRTSFNIDEYDPNQPDSNVVLIRAEFDTKKNMEQLQVAMNKLIQIDQHWQNLLMKITDVTESNTESANWNEKKYGKDNATGYLHIIDEADNEVLRLQIEEKQIRSLRTRPTTETGNLIPMPITATQPTPQLPQVHLPPLQPATFNGDPTKWGYFWQRFQPIHDLPTLPRAQKLHYLSAALEGSAAKTIASLPITDENYDVAVERLKKTYGDDEQLTTQLLLNLYKFPKAADDVRACRKTFDSLELLLQQLKAKNENIDQSTIQVQWSDKIPGWLLEAANNNMPQKTTFDDLRDEVNRILTNRERFSGKPEKVTVNAISVNDKKAAAKSSTKSATKTPDNRKLHCAFCSGEHHGSTCTQIESITDRWKFVSTNKLCFVCLKSGHRSNECRRRRPCFKCKKKHHPALCNEGTEETTEKTTAASVLSATKKSVLFQTKNLRIRTNNGNDTALTFFDSGSGSSFILNETAARLNLTSEGTTKMSVKRFHESSNFDITIEKYNVQIICLNGDVLTVPVKGVDSLVDVMKIPMNQSNQSFVYAKPELLIGIDNYWRFFYAKKARNGIRYVRTRCGDVFSGPIEAAEDEDDDTNVYINAALPGDEEDDNDKWLHKRLNVFFELEGTLGFKDDANATEAEIAQSLFDATTQLKDGRFHVSWPFKTKDVKVPLNLNAVIAHVQRLYKRLMKNGQIQTYTNVLLAHEEKGFIEKVGPLATTPIRAPGGNLTTYLTHRLVQRDSATTPNRVVFNCSFRIGSTSISFNDVLFIGPNYITNIPGILLRFRCYPTVVTCDIEKAFMQMILNDADRDCCRFLWLIDPTKPPEKENLMIMRYTRPLFGASASPFLLMACLAKLLKDFDTALAKEVASNLYVDNIIIGADTPQQAYDKFQEVAAMLQTASMPLTQFMSNSAEANKLAGVETAENTKVLGIQFNPLTDKISVRSTFDEAADDSDPPTKRAILSLINGVYDPLGTISPVVINFKVFLQKQWLTNKGWDEPLSDEDLIEWRRLTAVKSQKIVIPRRVTVTGTLATELHVFCRPGGWWRVRKTSDADLYEIHRLLPLHTKVKLSILLVTVSLGIADGCSETTSIVAKAEHCTNSAQGWITCEFDDTTELWMASGSTHCLLLKDHENRPLGSIQLEATSFSRCSPTKKRFTRMFKAASSSIKRCPAAGQCTGTTCADTKDDDAIDGLATANSMPGRSGCTESCGCWGCGCFICKEACIFYRYYALPTSDDVYTTFSCESTLPTVRLTASVKSDDKTHHYEQLLTAGQPEEYGDLTFTVVSTPESVHINKDWIFVTRRDQTAVLDTFGQSAATLLQCPTKLDAEHMTKKCVLHPDTCSCRTADSKMACRCQTNEGLRQAFQDAPLPLHTPQGWLRSTNGELLMGQTGLINIIVSSKKLTLTTMVDRNRCVNVKASIAGCYNCEQGATVEMSCKTDYGEALAHVECGSFHFAIHCMHEVRTQRIRVLATTAEIDEQCQLRCPAGSSAFTLRGLLYQPATTDPWAIAPHASRPASWFGQTASSLIAFFTASFLHFGLIAAGAVLLIALLKVVL